jgi:large subunit ribosomal protein L5
MSTTTPERADTKPRLQQRYREEIVPALREDFSFANVMQVPRLTKIVVNMGVGDAARDSKLIEGAVRDLSTITGQICVVSVCIGIVKTPSNSSC